MIHVLQSGNSSMGEDFYKMIRNSTITFPGLTKVDFFFPGFLWVEIRISIVQQQVKKGKKGKKREKQKNLSSSWDSNHLLMRYNQLYLNNNKIGNEQEICENNQKNQNEQESNDPSRKIERMCHWALFFPLP